MSMRFPKLLILGLAGSALVGALLASGSSPVLSAKAETDKPNQLTIPEGRIGDDVSYASFWRNQSDEAWKPYEERPAWSFRVLGAGKSYDRAGVEHDVIDVLTFVGSWRRDAEALPGSYEQWNESVRLHIDLATRHAIRIDFGSSNLQFVQTPSLPTQVEEFTQVYYGPKFGGGIGTLWAPSLVGATPFLMEYQGRTYRVGETQGADDSHLLDSTAVLNQGGSSGLTMSRSVMGAGAVDGVEALKVRTQGCVRLDSGMRVDYGFGWWTIHRGDGTRVPFLHAQVPLPSNVCFDVDVWLAESSPYPILYEERVVVNGTETHEWLEAPSRMNLGAAPIHWGQDAAVHHYLEADPSVEHSPPLATHPSDGSATWPPHRLSQAHDAVLADPTLVAFRSWREENPTFRLAGASYHEQFWACRPPRFGVAPAETLPMWKLTFGVPDGRYFLVQSMRRDGDWPVMNCELGSATGSRFSFDQMPQGLVTIGVLQKRWEMGLVGRLMPPNWIRWGSVSWCESAGVPQNPDLCDPQQKNNVLAGRLGWTTADIGSIGARDPNDPTPDLQNWVRVDALTGNVYEATDYISRPVPASFLGPETRETPPAASVAQTLDSPPRGWSAPLAATGGILALLLVAYLYPVLKYYGGQGLLLIPGYAKLRREELLNNRIREEVHNLIRNDPGISPPELQRAVQAGFSTVVYHLDILQRNGLVNSLIDGRHKRFFPADAIDWSKRGQISALRNAKSRALYDLILTEPGVFRDELARRIGLTAPGAIWHLERLEAAGLIGHDKVGRKMHYYPQAPAAAPRLVDQKEAVEVA